MSNTGNINVVSMLLSENKLTLFTDLGQIINLLPNNGYDTESVIKFLLNKLTGSNSVELDLDDYLIIKNVLNHNNKYENEGGSYF